MRIVQIGAYPIHFTKIRGGVESSVYGLVQELIKNHKVQVFDFPRIDGIDELSCTGNLIVYRFQNKGKHNEDAVRRIPEIVNGINIIHPDIVHVHGTNLFSAKIYEELHKLNIPLLLTIHGLTTVEKQNALNKSLYHVKQEPFSLVNWKNLIKAKYQFHIQSRAEYQLLETADTAIVDTEYLQTALKKYPIKKLPQLFVIPQGANEQFYHINPQPMQKCPTILCVGTFSQRKSQLGLIRAFEIVRTKGIDAKLVLCGTIAEKSYYEVVKSTISQSAYAQDIQLKEDLTKEQLLNEYASATIFALNSQEESQGIVLAEAMACGLPIISTKVGGIPYVVTAPIASNYDLQTNPYTGLLSDYGDTNALAQNIERLLIDDILRKTLSRNGKIAAARYHWTYIANQIVDIYQKIVRQ